MYVYIYIIVYVQSYMCLYIYICIIVCIYLYKCLLINNGLTMVDKYDNGIFVVVNVSTMGIQYLGKFHHNLTNLTVRPSPGHHGEFYGNNRLL